MLRLFLAALFLAAILSPQGAFVFAAPGPPHPEGPQGSATDGPPGPPAVPLVEVPETTHDIGKAPPNQVGEYTFTVRNRGGALLRIIRVTGG